MKLLTLCCPLLVSCLLLAGCDLNRAAAESIQATEKQVDVQGLQQWAASVVRSQTGGDV